MRRWIRLGLIIFSAALLLFAIGKFALTSKILVQITAPNDVAGLRVTIDGKEAANNSPNNFSSSVGPKKHQVLIRAAGFETQAVEITTFLRSNKQIISTLKEQSPVVLAESIARSDGSTNFRISGASYYGSRSWIVYYKAPAQPGNGEGSIGVARYNAQLSSWEIISEGSEIELGSYSNEAPGDLLVDLQDVLQ
jgi:hypothetical protein